MQLSSQAFVHNGSIPSQYTCDGNNTSPPLAMSGVPKEAISLVLIMDDPDAVKPAGRVWDHWIVFNIPPTTTIIEEGKEPKGIQGRGTSGSSGYQGPCPPDAEHRYFFKLYALDTMLRLPEGAAKKEVEAAMQGHVLAKAELRGRYERRERSGR
ncbi:YbhB/YbcL family Raf kinase inhibitor-like protein [Candidatus Woesearchaeota archaeon]|nr:YbhB/YbcL family Raf kinase inhibitor-like protein [Candidatus Woesearchaeota archaeon]